MKYISFLLLALVVVTGCATKPKLANVKTIEPVLVYPVIDVRANRRHTLSNSFILRPILADKISRLYEYPIRYACDHGIKAYASYDDCKYENRARLRGLQTAGENYVLLTFVKAYHDSTAKNILGLGAAIGFNAAAIASGSNFILVPGMKGDHVDVEAFLVRKDTGQIAWTYSGPFRGSFPDFPVIVKKRILRNELWKCYYSHSEMIMHGAK